MNHDFSDVLLRHITYALMIILIVSSTPLFANASDDRADSDSTPTVSLDRTVYPVPFGQVSDFAEDIISIIPDGRSVFPLHHSAIVTGNMRTSETLGAGDLMLHIRINDENLDVSSSNADTISQDMTGEAVGPLKISVSRDSQTMVLAYAGGSTPNKDGLVDVGDDDPNNTRQLGPITETETGSATFELDFVVRYTDGPSNQQCPATASFTSLNENMQPGSEESRFDESSPDNENYCIMGGDILTVEYAYLDESGNIVVASDSATFDLRAGVLLSDQEVYMIGSDMILTLIDPDLDLDNDVAETYSLDLIEWDSHAARMTMGQLGGEVSSFNPEPSAFRETGDSTGMFQVVVEIPDTLQENNLEQGEEIVLEYIDWSTPGADYVGQEDEDVQLTLYTSNSGATVQPNETVAGSAPIQWNEGKIEWLEASCPCSATGVVRVIDHDMNRDPEAVDNFDVDVWSDSDASGIDLTVTETNGNTGIFEGTVFFITTDESSGHKLRVAEGDTATAEYKDNTLPDPFTSTDDLDITAQLMTKERPLPPLKQQKLGILPQDVTCDEGLEKVFKHDGSAACASPLSVEKLIQRGYGTN